MQIRQRIFNCTDMQIMQFILDKILKLLTYYTPFYHQPLQSYLISKTVQFFGPPCIMCVVGWVFLDMLSLKRGTLQSRGGTG